MAENKRLILPFMVAIILHGLLFTCHLPKQPAIQVVPQGISIRIEIHSISPGKIATELPRKSAITVTQPPKKVNIHPDIFKKRRPGTQKNPAVTHQMKHKKIQITREEQIPPLEIAPTPPSQLVTKETPKANRTRRDKEIARKMEDPVPLAPQKARPKYQQNRKPLYPVMAKRRGYDGEVLLEVLVNAQGRVDKLKIKNSCGHIILDRAALQTVKTWLFIPATDGRRAVPMWVDVPIKFQFK